MVQQAGAGGKYRIKRQTGLLQGDSPEKSDIQVRARPGNKAIGDDIEKLDGVKCPERAPRIVGEFELPIDLSRHDGLVIPVVHDEHWTFGKFRCQLVLEAFPG